jgi:hypothetical protein
MNVAVLGASNNPERYSYKAIKMLLEKGHTPFPVHPNIRSIEDLPVYRSLEDTPDRIDTITVYLSATHSDRFAEDILASGARRIIFNPGAENPVLAGRLRAAGMEVVEACTLVMLTLKQF